MPLLGDDLMEQIRKQKLDDSMVLPTNPAGGERQFVVLNTKGSTSDAKVRQAFASSLDRSEIGVAMNAEDNMLPTWRLWNRNRPVDTTRE